MWRWAHYQDYEWRDGFFYCIQLFSIIRIFFCQMSPGKPTGCLSFDAIKHRFVPEKTFRIYPIPSWISPESVRISCVRAIDILSIRPVVTPELKEHIGMQSIVRLEGLQSTTLLPNFGQSQTQKSDVSQYYSSFKCKDGIRRNTRNVGNDTTNITCTTPGSRLFLFSSIRDMLF